MDLAFEANGKVFNDGGRFETGVIMRGSAELLIFAQQMPLVIERRGPIRQRILAPCRRGKRLLISEHQ